jgi:hypothetical protein
VSCFQEDGAPLAQPIPEPDKLERAALIWITGGASGVETETLGRTVSARLGFELRQSAKLADKSTGAPSLARWS